MLSINTYKHNMSLSCKHSL